MAEIHIKNVDPKLKQRFKALAANLGIPLRELLIQLISNAVKGTK